MLIPDQQIFFTVLWLIKSLWVSSQWLRDTVSDLWHSDPLVWFWFELFTLPELGCLKQEKLNELKYEHYILSVNSQCCDVLIIWCFLLLLSSSDVITPRLHQGCWGGVCLTGVQRCKGIAIKKQNCGNVITWCFIILRTAASCCFQNLLICWSLNWFCL